MSQRIYIALPSGYTRETAYAAEDALTLLGYEPANPATTMAMTEPTCAC